MSKPDAERNEPDGGVGGTEGVTVGNVESTENTASETSDEVRHALSVAVMRTRTEFESIAPVVQTYDQEFGRFDATLVQSVPLRV